MLVRLGMMSLEDNQRSWPQLASPTFTDFAEVTKLAYWMRLAYSGDPDVKPPPYDRAAVHGATGSEQNAEDRSRRGAGRLRSLGHRRTEQSVNTTHFVVADRWGNIVSATVTLGNLFGSRIMPEGTGIWLNNSLAYCTFEPKGNPMDAHPGRRKLSSDAPSLGAPRRTAVDRRRHPRRPHHHPDRRPDDHERRRLRHGHPDRQSTAPRIAFNDPTTSMSKRRSPPQPAKP